MVTDCILSPRVPGHPKQFAKRLLRNAGQLVCIDPSLGMAEFIGEFCHRTRSGPRGLVRFGLTRR